MVISQKMFSLSAKTYQWGVANLRIQENSSFLTNEFLVTEVTFFIHCTSVSNHFNLRNVFKKLINLVLLES